MDYKGINDYELMYRIKENDEDAINLMIGKYEPIIVNIAKKYYPKLKGLGIEMADLIQEGRIAVVKAVNSYNPDGVSIFYTYVCVCIERSLITYWRNLSTNKQKALNYSVNDEYIYTVEDVTFEPINYLMQKYNDEMFIRSKNFFDFLDSNIFELRYNGFTYREISELLDISIRVVDSRLCRIRKSLQRRENKF